MPNFCKFINRETNEPITLIELDKLLCTEMDIEPKDDYMCPLYNALCLTGFAIMAKSHSSFLTQEDFDAYMEKNGDDYDQDLFHRYLIRDYKFEAWAKIGR